MGAFGAHHHRTRHLLDRRDLSQWDERFPTAGKVGCIHWGRRASASGGTRTEAVDGGDQDRGEPLRIVAQLYRIPDAHAVALPPLHGLGDHHAAHRRCDHGLHVAHVEAVARRRCAVDVDVQVIPRHRPLRERAPGTPDHLDRAFDFLAQPLELGEIGSEDLDSHWRTDAGGEHVDPRLDRHRPRIGDAGEPNRRVHRRDQRVVGHPLPPCRLRLERDRGLEHVEARRISRGVGAARLAPDVFHLGKALQDPVLDPEDLARPGHAHPRQRRGHEKDGSLAERRHELAADPRPGNRGQHKGHECGPDNRPAAPQHEGDDGMVCRDQPAVDRIGPLPVDLAPDEEPHRDRHDRHREETRRRHREGLGEGERLEEASLLPFEGEDRQERHRDDQQRNE